MKDIVNIKKAFFEIAQLLAQDDLLCKLLLNDADTAITDDTPEHDINTMIQEHYISMYPPVENRIEDYGRNTFLSVIIDSVNFHGTDNTTPASLIIYVSTDEAHLILQNNRNRLLEIADRVIRVLDAQKLSSSGTLDVRSMVHVMLSEFHPAYRISIGLTDQPNGKAGV